LLDGNVSDLIHRAPYSVNMEKKLSHDSAVVDAPPQLGGLRVILREGGASIVAARQVLVIWNARPASAASSYATI